MKRSIFFAIVFGVFCFTIATPVSTQQNDSKTKKALRVTGKVTMVLVKSAAKITFEAAKLAGKHIVVPTAKNVVVPIAKATPPVAKATAKLAGKGIKNGFKLIFKRDKAKDPPTAATSDT